jgi:hypothetical protein
MLDAKPILVAGPYLAVLPTSADPAFLAFVRDCLVLSARLSAKNGTVPAATLDDALVHLGFVNEGFRREPALVVPATKPAVGAKPQPLLDVISHLVRRITPVDIRTALEAAEPGEPDGWWQARTTGEDYTTLDLVLPGTTTADSLLHLSLVVPCSFDQAHWEEAARAPSPASDVNLSSFGAGRDWRATAEDLSTRLATPQPAN